MAPDRQSPSLVKLGSGARLSDGSSGGTIPVAAWAPALFGPATALFGPDPDVAAADMAGRADAPVAGAVTTPVISDAERTPSPINVFQVFGCIGYVFPVRTAVRPWRASWTWGGGLRGVSDTRHVDEINFATITVLLPLPPLPNQLSHTDGDVRNALCAINDHEPSPKEILK
jgi:hypothetical protein